jgi:hypothetical protein
VLALFVATCSDVISCILDEALHRQVACFVLDYIFKGESRFLGDEKFFKLVEYGIARFGLVKLQAILVDEPLALLAALHYFATETKWTLQHFLLGGVSNMDPATRGKALEYVGAYLLADAFKSPRRLSEIFTFVSPNELAEKVAYLVCIDKTEGMESCAPVAIFSDQPQTGTYILGQTITNEKDMASWLKNPSRCVFLFPAHTPSDQT